MKRWIALVLLMLWAMPVLAEAVTSQARVLSVKGDVQYRRASGGDWTALDKSVVLKEGDSVKTGPSGEAQLELTGNAKTGELTVHYGSEFTLKAFNHDPGTKLENTLLDVNIGSVLVKAEKLVGDSKFEAKTPTSIVGIRGTVFEVQVSKA